MRLHQNIDDHTLFDLVKAEANVDAFKEIYDRYFEALFIHAMKRLRDKEEAQDVVQDVFTILWTKKDYISLTDSLPAYLFTAVRNRILNVISHKHVESSYIQSIQEFVNQEICQTDHLLRENDLANLIEKEISSLPLRMQEIFILSRKEHRSHKEIAKELHLSEQTVKKQVQNALKILRVKLTSIMMILLVIF